MIATQGRLHIPSLVSEDKQYTSVESAFNIPTMSEFGAEMNVSSPLYEGNAGFFEWFDSEEKEHEGEKPNGETETKKPAINLTGMMIITGVIVIATFLIFKKKGG